ncbi:MAG: peptidoglycan-binding domain-containing protein [Lachnospiraceae bacterium]|nr:peptidoglycan-binding domain-containing protein [Lachnospiraceae bacterium]
MSKKPTALQVMRIALQQYAYKETPAGSNRTKFGKAFGMNGVPWCAEFVWYAGEKAPETNPFAKSASAAYIQDNTVTNKGGHYVLKQTSSNARKKSALSSYRFGDNISFNFSGGSSRMHTGLIVGVVGSSIYCIEGNTSFSSDGSQSNGGCVALRKRSYTTGVCVVRPNYTPFKWHVPNEPYHGHIPALPKDKTFDYRDKGDAVKVLQKALSWANGYNLKADGVFGSHTFAEVVIFQCSQGLVPDGQFGPASLKALKKLIEKHKGDTNPAPIVVTTKATKTKKTKAQKLVERCKKDAWPYGTKKSVYRYPSGRPRKQYKKDLAKVYPNRKNWSTQPSKGASCDVGVGTVVRASGVDPKFPRGLDEQLPYLKKSKKFKRVKKPKAGDIIYQLYKSGGGHISIKVKKGFVYNAHYYGKTYPVIQKYADQVKPRSKCKVSLIFRPV